MRCYRDGLAAAILVLALIGVCKSGPLPSEEETATPAKIRPPNIIYAAGPNQLTLMIGDKGAVRFGYETDNQFRAERRYPNGTVAGIYGYIGADGVPVKVKYGAVDELGFQAMQEVIPNKFPALETSTPAGGEEDKGEGKMRMMESEEPSGEIVENDKNSVSVESAAEIQPRRKFVFPKIHLEEFANRPGRSLPEAVPIVAPATVAFDTR